MGCSSRCQEGHGSVRDRKGPINGLRSSGNAACELRSDTKTVTEKVRRGDAIVVLKYMRSIEIKCLNACGRQDEN